MQEHFPTEVPSDIEPIPDDPGEGLRLAPAEVQEHAPSAEPRFGYQQPYINKYDKDGHYQGWEWTK